MNMTREKFLILRKVLPISIERWGHELALSPLLSFFSLLECKQKWGSAVGDYFFLTNFFRKPQRERTTQRVLKKGFTLHFRLFFWVWVTFRDFRWDFLISLDSKTLDNCDESLANDGGELFFEHLLCFFFLRRIFAWGWLKYSYLTTKASLLGAWLTI